MRQQNRKGLNRRSLLKSAAAIGAFPLVNISRSWAAEEAVGNYPAGVQGDSVFVGVIVPLTGAYSAEGADHLKGFQLAFEHLNNGGGLVSKIPTLSGKGVLGKKIKYKWADNQTKPGPAVQAATQFITNDKAMMISGCSSSATAIALEKVAQRYRVINMVGGSGANETTGKDCQRYAFRSQPSAYMAAKALAPAIGKELGHNRKAVYLVPDYAYGHSVFESTSKFTEEELGWKTVGQQLCPVGTSDYSSFLLNIANSGADVFVNVAFGADSVASTKQAKQFGVLDKMKMIVPNLSAFQGKEVGPEIMQGVYGTLDFWWTLAETIPEAKIFVDAFEEKYKYKPRWLAHIAYTQMLVWADAVERAKTFNPIAVIKALEAEHKLKMPLGEVYYRACDHQQVRAVPVVVGKKPSEMRNPEDIFKVVGLTPGPDVVPPCDSTSCKLPSY
ncbi:MAG TPA: substrate-binding protein [Pseudolabrys sp.]|jgi:ABC-type branched-subunit amino acid transport system substrate-binding protein|nr:substrate-binding protein [Pseudolabrys sp.]